MYSHNCQATDCIIRLLRVQEAAACSANPAKFATFIAMPLLERVVWAKGTRLNPQHLQIQDRYLEEAMRFQLSALSFRPWGFERLLVDRDALAGGIFSITAASGIMSDGLLFDIPGADAPPQQRPIADQFGPDQDSLDVFLAIPNYRERGLNIAGTLADKAPRYRAEVEMIRDDNTGQSEKPVLVARKNFRLLVEGEDREGYSALRVGTVYKTPAGLFQLHPQFVAPLLDLNASDYLTSILRRLVEILAARSSALSGARRQKNQSLADFSASDIASFWLLYTVNTFLPKFRHIFETRGGHPEVLYSAMVELAGALTTFSSTVHPRDLPVYEHDNLGRCFGDLDEKIRFLLETVVPSNFISLPLKYVQPSIYATSLESDSYLVNTKMYLAISADAPPADIIARGPHLIKICSSDYIDHLVQRALPGLALTHVPNPPAAIAMKLDYRYFSLSQAGGPWEAITRARNLAAYVPGDFPNPQMELIILLPQAG